MDPSMARSRLRVCITGTAADCWDSTKQGHFQNCLFFFCDNSYPWIVACLGGSGGQVLWASDEDNPAGILDPYPEQHACHT